MLKILRNTALILSAVLLAVIAYDYFRENPSILKKQGGKNLPTLEASDKAAKKTKKQTQKSAAKKSAKKVMTKKELAALPENTVINGNVTIKQADFESLPAGMQVKGDLIIYSGKGIEKVKKSQVLGKIKVRKVYEPGTADSEIEISATHSKKKAPNVNVWVDSRERRDLWEIVRNSWPKKDETAEDDYLIKNAELLAPKAKYVKTSHATSYYKPKWSDDDNALISRGQKVFDGDVDIDGANLSKLPSGLRIAGNLYMRHTNITALPSDIRISGNIYVEGTPLKKISSGAFIGGRIIDDSKV